MASILIRFPDGTKEFRYHERQLQPDDILLHDGAHFRVVSVSGDGNGRDVVVVESASHGIGDLLLSEEGAIRLVAIE